MILLIYALVSLIGAAFWAQLKLYREVTILDVVFWIAVGPILLIICVAVKLDSIKLWRGDL